MNSNGDLKTAATNGATNRTADQLKRAASAERRAIVRESDMHDFIVQCIKKAATQAPEPHADVAEVEAGARRLAALLTHADRRGHYSHGVNRLDNYLGEVANGVGVGSADGGPTVVRRKGGTALVDGADCLGVVVGEFCAQLAAEMAREHGIAWIVARNSNHFGICAHYALQIAAAGYIGMSYTNASPILFLKGAAEKSVGSNPICVVANASRDQFALDMATSNVAYGKIEIADAKKHSIPPHWATDRDGGATTSAPVAMDDGGLLPLGALSGASKSEAPATNGTTKPAAPYAQDASHKGSGLAMMVELFTSILGGASVGTQVRKWRDYKRSADLGQCFVALDPSCFVDDFPERLQAFIDEVHGLKRTDDDVPVLVPGEPELAHNAKCEAAGGIIYDWFTVGKLKAVAAEFNVNMFPYKEEGTDDSKCAIEM